MFGHINSLFLVWLCIEFNILTYSSRPFLYLKSYVTDIAWWCEGFRTTDWPGFLSANCPCFWQTGTYSYLSWISYALLLWTLTEVYILFLGTSGSQWYDTLALSPCCMQSEIVNCDNFSTMARGCSSFDCVLQGNFNVIFKLLKYDCLNKQFRKNFHQVWLQWLKCMSTFTLNFIWHLVAVIHIARLQQ